MFRNIRLTATVVLVLLVSAVLLLAHRLVSKSETTLTASRATGMTAADIKGYLENYALQALAGEKLQLTFLHGPASGLYMTDAHSAEQATHALDAGRVKIVAKRLADKYFGQAQNDAERSRMYEKFVLQADQGFSLCWFQDVRGGDVAKHLQDPGVAAQYAIPLSEVDLFRNQANEAMKFWRDVMALAGRKTYS